MLKQSLDEHVRQSPAHRVVISLDGVPAANAFNQPGAIAARLSEVVEHRKSDTG